MDETSTEDQVIEPIIEKPNTPLDILLDEHEDLKQRVARLEKAISAHGHSVDIGTGTLDQIAELVLQRVNALISARKA